MLHQLKVNLCWDQVTPEDLPQEHLEGRIQPFLANFVPFFHPSWLTITYKLGKVTDSPDSRKALWLLGF